MKISDWQKKKIDMLAKYQEMLADIYTLLGEKNPLYDKILLPLAIRNLTYADWLRSLPDKIISGQYEYKMMRFKIESISTGVNYLYAQFQSIKEKNISIYNAIGVLKGVESSDLAAKFYEIVLDVNEHSEELENLKNSFKLEKIDTKRTLQCVVKKKVEHSLQC